MIKVLYILNIGIIKLIDAALFQKKNCMYKKTLIPVILL